MSRYRKIETRLWGDERFCNLTPLLPSGQALWLFILTGPHTGPIPGIYRASRAAMADELRWDLEDFDRAFQEIQGMPEAIADGMRYAMPEAMPEAIADGMRYAMPEAMPEAIADGLQHGYVDGMAQADWKAKVLWVPNAIKYNKPESMNVILSWATEWDLIPECDLKRAAYETLRANLYAASEAYGKAFDRACVKPSPKPYVKPYVKPSPKGCPIQEQQQQQQQEKVKTLPTDQAEKTSLILTGEFLPAAPAGRKDPKPEIDTELQLACKATWDSYAAAYRKKYGVAPIRNAPVNSQIKAMVQRIGREESPMVAAFYLTHSDGYYVRKAHDTGTLLKDCEKLRMEWATGRRGTAAAARQADRTQTNAAAGLDALAMLQQGA